jgi:hypothetical protein
VLDGPDLSAEKLPVDTASRVALGAALTVFVWVLVGYLGLFGFDVGSPIVLAVIVAVLGRRMRWGARTALVSACISALPILVDIVLLGDREHAHVLAWLVVLQGATVAATWLAWKGGLIVANRPRTNSPHSISAP